MAKSAPNHQPSAPEVGQELISFTDRLFWHRLKQIGFFLAALVALILLFKSHFDNSIYHIYTALKFFVFASFLWIFTLFKAKKYFPSFLVYIGTGFLFFTWLSFFFSQAKTVGLAEVILDTALILGLFTFPLMLRYLKSWKEPFFALVLASGVVQAGFALFQYLTRSEDRVAGFFFNPEIIADYYPNAFALSSLLFLTLALAFFSKRSWGWKLYGGFSSVLILSALLLTWSRGAVVALFGMLFLGLLWIVFYHRNWKKVLIFLLIPLFGFLLAAGFHFQRSHGNLEVNEVTDKVQFQGTEAQTSVGERKDFMLNGLALIKNHPLLGYGPATFPLIYPQLQEVWQATSGHPHNWFIKLALERGLLAMTFFALFWFWLLFSYLKRFSARSEFSNWILIGLLAVFAHNLVDFNFNFVSNVLLLALLASILIAELEFKPLDKINRFSYWMLLLPLMGLLVLSARSIYWDRFYPALNTLSVNNYQTVEPNSFFAGDHYLRLALFAREQGNYDFSERMFLKHLELAPVDAFAHNQLGEVYMLTEDYDLALQSFDRALALNDKNYWNFYTNALLALEGLGQRDEIQKRLPVYLDELNAYVPLAELNVHFTAQHVNAEWAMDLIQFLQKYAQGQDLEHLNDLEGRLQEAREFYSRE